MQREQVVAETQNGTHRQVVEFRFMAALDMAIAALTVQLKIHVIRARRRRDVPGRFPCLLKRAGIRSPAFKTGPMPIRESGDFIQKEQFRITAAHDVALTFLEA